MAEDKKRKKSKNPSLRDLAPAPATQPAPNPAPPTRATTRRQFGEQHAFPRSPYARTPDEPPPPMNPPPARRVRQVATPPGRQAQASGLAGVVRPAAPSDPVAMQQVSEWPNPPNRFAKMLGQANRKSMQLRDRFFDAVGDAVDVLIPSDPKDAGRAARATTDALLMGPKDLYRFYTGGNPGETGAQFARGFMNPASASAEPPSAGRTPTPGNRPGTQAERGGTPRTGAQSGLANALTAEPNSTEPPPRGEFAVTPGDEDGVQGRYTMPGGRLAATIDYDPRNQTPLKALPETGRSASGLDNGFVKAVNQRMRQAGEQGEVPGGTLSVNAGPGSAGMSKAQWEGLTNAERIARNVAAYDSARQSVRDLRNARRAAEGSPAVGARRGATAPGIPKPDFSDLKGLSPGRAARIRTQRMQDYRQAVQDRQQNAIDNNQWRSEQAAERRRDRWEQANIASQIEKRQAEIAGTGTETRRERIENAQEDQAHSSQMVRDFFGAAKTAANADNPTAEQAQRWAPILGDLGGSGFTMANTIERLNSKINANNTLGEKWRSLFGSNSKISARTLDHTLDAYTQLLTHYEQKGTDPNFEYTPPGADRSVRINIGNLSNTDFRELAEVHRVLQQRRDQMAQAQGV